MFLCTSFFYFRGVQASENWRGGGTRSAGHVLGRSSQGCSEVEASASAYFHPCFIYSSHSFIHLVTILIIYRGQGILEF